MQSAAALSKELEGDAIRPDASPDGDGRRPRVASANPGAFKKTRLATFLRSHRKASGLTQQSLAQKLGVRASHIALLENGRRRPSLGLVVRLANALGVDGRELLQLAYPEVRELVSPIAQRRPKPSRSWQRLFKDRALLARYHVTRQELDMLGHLAMLGGKLTAKRFLAILLLVRDTP
jgi:transcriptional regulator with XRE-family HTH domain